MFDPTVFENLKVVAEGAVYDLDLAGAVFVKNREDIINLASMGRTYSITFCLNDAVYDIAAAFILTADVKHLAGEILEDESFTPGCGLQLQFSFPLSSSKQLFQPIEEVLRQTWGSERVITQTASQRYEKEQSSYWHTATILFQKTITEEHAEDLSAIVDYMVETLEQLQQFLKNVTKGE